MAEAWADWAGLKVRYPSEDITDEQYQEAVEAATWLLTILSNGMVHGPQGWIEEYRISHTCEIGLRRTPLTAIDKVELVQGCGRTAPQLIDPSEYCIVRSQTISFCCGNAIGRGLIEWPYGTWHDWWRPCGCNDDAVRITYQIGGNLPPGTESMILWLAEQFLRNDAGDSCSLPERVTSISRQGVSWSMLDSMDFLDKGLTGVGRIDQWLAAVRRAYPPVAIIDPVRSERLLSTLGTTTPGGVSARPGDVDLELYEGDDFFMDIVVKNPDGTPAPVGTPLAQIRSDSGAILATFQTTVTGSTINLHLPGAIVRESLVGVWDCQVTDANDQVTTLVAGSVTTTAEVSVPPVAATVGLVDWAERPSEPTATTHIDWGET